MALAGRIVQLACAFITHQQSWRLEQKHRMHPREAVFPPRFRLLGWTGHRPLGVAAHCGSRGLAGRIGWLIALRLRQGKGKARRRMRQQPGMRVWASAIRRGDLELKVIVRPFCPHRVLMLAAPHRAAACVLRACVLPDQGCVGQLQHGASMQRAKLVRLATRSVRACKAGPS